MCRKSVIALAYYKSSRSKTHPFSIDVTPSHICSYCVSHLTLSLGVYFTLRTHLWRDGSRDYFMNAKCKRLFFGWQQWNGGAPVFNNNNNV